MAGFEDLEVWKRAVELSVEIYRETLALKDLDSEIKSLGPVCRSHPISRKVWNARLRPIKLSSSTTLAAPAGNFEHKSSLVQESDSYNNRKQNSGCRIPKKSPL